VARQVGAAPFLRRHRFALAFLPLTFSAGDNKKWAPLALWTVYHVHHGEKLHNPG
jgi:hypothetical protein